MKEKNSSVDTSNREMNEQNGSINTSNKGMKEKNGSTITSNSGANKRNSSLDSSNKMVNEQNTLIDTSEGITFLKNDFELIGGDPDAIVDSGFTSDSYWRDVRRRFFSNRGAVIALAFILLIVLFAAFGPGMNIYSYKDQNLSQKNFAPRIPFLEQLGILDGDENLKTTTGVKLINGYKDKELPSVYYWFGSDTLGRDIWTRVWEGARISLGIAIVSALINMTLGMSYGLISGYFGGITDSIMQRFAEINNGIPRLVIVTLLLLILKPGFVTIVLALVITDWISMSRIARAEMLKLKEQEFVLASRTLGANHKTLIFGEVLPNIIGQVFTQLMFSIPTAIFTEAFLSFVGLGIPVPQCSLGSLINDAFSSFTTHPYQIIPPILVLALLMLCFNILADGLREAFDPKLKEM